MKRILVILNTPANSMYGASKSFRAHYDLLNDNYNFDVLSQLSFNKDKLKHSAGAFLILRNALGYTFSFRENIFTILKFLLGIIYLPIVLSKAHKADIIHLNSLTLVLYAPLLKFLFPSKEIICHVREILVRYKYITKRCLNSVDKIVCIDQEVRGLITINENKVKTFVVSNPVVIKKVDKKFNFGIENYLNVGVVGRLSEEKKIIEILKYINLGNYKSDKPVMFHIVGGAGADTSYYNNCMMMMKNLANVHYLGEVDNLENTNFYEQIDCLLRFDGHYSIGRTILEAINFGVNIYTEKDILSSILSTGKVAFSSKFFSLENDKELHFKMKDRTDDINKISFTECLNKIYINNFRENIYG